MLRRTSVRIHQKHREHNGHLQLRPYASSASSTTTMHNDYGSMGAAPNGILKSAAESPAARSPGGEFTTENALAGVLKKSTVVVAPLAENESVSEHTTILRTPSFATRAREFRFLDDALSMTPSAVSSSAQNVAAKMASLRRRSSIVRDKWASKLEFMLAVVGYAVDLGNIWRFPSVCYKHGGGAFLIPYFVMLIVGGLPMFYLELALGQYHRSGCISIWQKICPMFKGIGIGICFICTFIACFYNAIIAHAVFFVFGSLKTMSLDVPWKTCNNSWNTPLCTDKTNVTEGVAGMRTASEEYYLFNVLQSNKATGFDDLGGLNWPLAFCLILVFTLVYFALWKGPRSSGKVVWITATAPYIILTILLIRGLTLPGAAKGIEYYLTPRFDKLLEPEVWTAAATQIFFSLGPGFGVLLALSSYNEFNNNCHRDAVVTSLINCFTSFFSGFVIFSTLGYMSELTKKPVSEVVGDSENSLIFIVYPQAIATMQYSNVWSVIFFVMLITLGIDSTFAGIEALITGFCDEFPRTLQRKREYFVLVVIIIYYFGSLPTVTYGGSFVIPFIDEYGVSLSVLFIVCCEMIAVCWFYGVTRFSEDIRQMLGKYPGLYWRVCWSICPVFIGAIFIISVYHTNFSPLQLPNYVYPEWSVLLGWTMRMLSVCSIPVVAIYLFIRTPGTFSERMRALLTPQQRRGSMVSSVHSLPCSGDPNHQSTVLLASPSATDDHFNSNNSVAHL
ncbi:hypothetical protein QR680_007417 [Steinernema hermaphroditum]|uniref:Transporter n=1 Tax=Steinernema hermaphroditum TaxID=289476 RepID=A0AA39ID64_9BILA|nr:hypothetical protein QR680_007417 [Steinernema hermaphroditum]